MMIWIDADACPRVVRDIIFRAATRTATPVTLVANQPIHAPPGRLFRAVTVREGADRADDHIVEHATTEDLIITADIPLAARIVELGALALNPRGQLYDANNVRERLSIRDFMQDLRDSGHEGGGPPPLTERDKRTFANALDRILTQHARRPK